MVKPLSDEYYMRQALVLARRGQGRTSPNPMVGAVIVRDGEIIGRGYHKRYGDKHAEVNAIEDAGGDVAGAALYVTLEPCCHYGKKTPPCVNAVIQSGIKRVIAGTLDPNPEVNGKGAQILRAHGIEVKLGVLQDRCLQLNQAYFKYIQTGVPFVTVKYAQTLDGRVAAKSGSSRWISSEPSLKYTHRLRSINDGIMVGIGTVLADDPQLTVRLVKGRNPWRIVVDSKLRIPLESRVLRAQEPPGTIIASTAEADPEKIAALKSMKVEVLIVEVDGEGRVDLGHLLKRLGERGLASVLVEGGPGIITSLLKAGLVDKLVVFIAPKILGRGLDAIGELNIFSLQQAIGLSTVRMRKSGDDFVLEAVIPKG